MTTQCIDGDVKPYSLTHSLNWTGLDATCLRVRSEIQFIVGGIDQRSSSSLFAAQCRQALKASHGARQAASGHGRFHKDCCRPDGPDTAAIRDSKTWRSPVHQVLRLSIYMAACCTHLHRVTRSQSPSLKNVSARLLKTAVQGRNIQG